MKRGVGGGRKKEDPLDFGPFEVLGDGAQVFGHESGMVAQCRVQWADDDDEACGEADWERGERMAHLICRLLNAHFGHGGPRERAESNQENA